MSMIKKGAMGKIESYTQEEDDGAIICQACQKIIVSKVNLGENNTCPYCHRNVNESLSNGDVIAESV